MNSVPHPAGSKQDYETAVYTAKQFESYGISAEIKEYYPLLSVPVHRKLSILEPAEAARELNLTEGSVSGDACTTNEDALPPFLAYSDSGNVTASVVYINKGTQEDFKWLLENNVTLKGKIALVRYGGNFRGLKVMISEQHEMAGVLIYSDPKDDGFIVGPVYPDGPWRPADSFQRGSVQYNSLYGGDPLTPGFASLPGAPYLSIEECDAIPHIPTLPLSYGQASYILESLGGKKAPGSWQGGLTFDDGYYVGDDERTVLNLDLEIDNKIGPIWDVIGTIEGDEEPEQMVVIGNHRDAWVCGAVDPSSASAVMMEIARGLGELLKTGWKPRRTIVISSWDGEEYGLLGSTEFAEDQAELLKKQAVAYINVDLVYGPNVATGGTPSIAKFLKETAKLVPANKFYGTETETSLYEQWVAETADRRALLPAGADDGTLGPDHMIAFLGSGTDFTAFYQHLGIISANLGFGFKNAASYGVYHSTMDSLKYMETAGDPNYATHTTTAKWWGLVTLRLANDAILPFDYTTYGLVMDEDLSGFEAKTIALGHDVDYSGLRAAISAFSANSELFQARVVQFAVKDTTSNDAESEKALRLYWNNKLVSLERLLTSDEGLPHRPWFKHLIFGPGFYEGYAGTAFPGLSDGIVFGDDTATIQAHVDDLAAVVSGAGAFLVAF